MTRRRRIRQNDCRMTNKTIKWQQIFEMTNDGRSDNDVDNVLCSKDIWRWHDAWRRHVVGRSDGWLIDYWYDVTVCQSWLCDWRRDCGMLLSIDCRQNQRKRGVGWILPLVLPFQPMIVGLIINPASSPYSPLNNNNNIMGLVKEKLPRAKKCLKD